MRYSMSNAGISFVLTAVVAGVIIGDHLLTVPWKFAIWGLGLSLPWIVMTRLVVRRRD
jgi:hypothetical protein